MIKPLRADWRIVRNWNRIWRDPPGFMGPGYRKCKCCVHTNPCTTCSGGIADTVHATFSSSGHCAALDGQTFLLTYSASIFGSSGWYYTFTDSNGCKWDIFLICLDATHLRIELAYQPGVGVTFGIKNSSSVTCSPLNATFSALQYNTVVGTCSTCLNAGISPAWNVTVTA